YLSFTAGLSGSFDTACLVRDQVLEEHPDFELYVVDTLQASLTEGLFIMEALALREKGMTAKELVAWAEEARYFVDELFMIDDLDVLKRGGRIPASVAVAGGKLDVKPLLNIDVDGHLGIAGVSRGRKKGFKQLLAYYEKNCFKEGGAHQVMVGGADCEHDVDRLIDMVQKADPDAIIHKGNIGPVIGSHVGPGMIAVVFWGNDKRKTLSISDRIARRVKGD
ncbi:MAG: DegV family protein, partial [Coriobacteriia bacterium]|nr:DegV family protein [Coriobacteriia bacterium]